MYEIPEVIKQVEWSMAGAFHPHTYGISLVRQLQLLLRLKIMSVVDKMDVIFRNSYN